MRVPTMVAVTSLVSGCLGWSVRPGCDENRVAVALDEVTEMGTAQELVDLIGVHGDLEAELEDGTLTTASVLATHTGAAEWVERTTSSQKRRRLGFGTVSVSIHVVCDSSLDVEVESRVTTPEGDVDIVTTGWVQMRKLYGTTPLPQGYLTGDYTLGVFPLAEDDPEDFDHKQAFTNLVWDEDMALTGSAGWSGSQETSKGTAASSVYSIEFWSPDGGTTTSTGTGSPTTATGSTPPDY